MKNLPPAVGEMADRVRHVNVDRRSARDIIVCLDLTAINRNVNPMLVNHLCRDADQGRHGRAAAIVVHTTFLSQAFNNVARKRVPVGTVVNFPQGGGTSEQTARDTRSAIIKGASEIEIVIDHAALRRGDKGHVRDLLRACRESCGKDAIMKVVLETSAFDDYGALYEAAELALDCGADMLVTATGMNSQNGRSHTSLEAAASMLHAIRNNGNRAGIKIAGEQDSARAHAPYIALARRMMGDDWVTPVNFRIGGRALQADALRWLQPGLPPPSHQGSGI